MFYEAFIKWFAFVDGIEPAGNLLRNLHKFCRDELKALFLEPADYFGDQVSLNGIRLDNN
jgi:hypothetical protein